MPLMIMTEQQSYHGVEHDKEPTFFSLPDVSIETVDFLDHGRPVMELHGHHIKVTAMVFKMTRTVTSHWP